jgi:hypothetical protein
VEICWVADGVGCCAYDRCGIARSFHIPEYDIYQKFDANPIILIEYSIFWNMEQKSLRPQDVIVLLKLLARRSSMRPTYAELSKDLFISPSQVFRSMRRAESAYLLGAPGLSPPPDFPGDSPRVWLVPNYGNLKEFLIHGIKYVFPVERRGPTRGVRTAEAAPPLDKWFPQDDFSLPPVWPYANGSVRGISFSPLYKNAPQAALQDPKLYELLALVDAIREGRAREREIAIRELTARIDAK